MRRIWEDAAGILETASSAATAQSDIAILFDERNGMRIVDASGWTIEGLRREYRATTAYTVTRTTDAVIVEGQSGSEHCTLRQRNRHANPLASLLGGILPSKTAGGALLLA